MSSSIAYRTSCKSRIHASCKASAQSLIEMGSVGSGESDLVCLRLHYPISLFDSFHNRNIRFIHEFDVDAVEDGGRWHRQPVRTRWLKHGHAFPFFRAVQNESPHRLGRDLERSGNRLASLPGDIVFASNILEEVFEQRIVGSKRPRQVGALE